MITRQKFSYMAFGAALMFLGTLLTLMSPLTAQRDKFGHIECTKLTVVDSRGKAMVRLYANDNGGWLDVYGKLDSKLRATVNVGSNGGGVIQVKNFIGENRGGSAQLKVDESGGRLDVFGKADDKSSATVAINEYGNGVVNTWDKNGYRLK